MQRVLGPTDVEEFTSMRIKRRRSGRGPRTKPPCCASIPEHRRDRECRNLLLNTGQLTETGLCRTADGGLNASWVLSWPEQRETGIEPIMLQAYFGGGFHHPHLRGTTVHDWPLNVFSDEDAAEQLSVLRAIASSDLHNLVYRTDYRIVPVVTAKSSTPRPRSEAT